MHLSLAALVAVVPIVAAGFPPQDVRIRNVTVEKAPGNEGITISYKNPRGACTTKSDEQEQITGWVHVPGPVPSNYFFWFIAARERTDSLTVWLNGGPGGSSLHGLFAENGPCEVIEKGRDLYATVPREWGWDRGSNMLYIDQANFVGFSYDEPTNGTFVAEEMNYQTPPLPANHSIPPWMMMNGTFGTNMPNRTVDSAEGAAMGIWQTIQTFLMTFPRYQARPSAPDVGFWQTIHSFVTTVTQSQAPASPPVALNIFAESWGGMLGPALAETVVKQNDKRSKGELSRDSTLELRLTSLGLVSGNIDLLVQTPQAMAFGANNTYGLQILRDPSPDELLYDYNVKGGARDLIRDCQSAVATSPDQVYTNELCQNATLVNRRFQTAIIGEGGSTMDISMQQSEAPVSYRYVDYLNQGPPIGYDRSGDQAKGGHIERIASLLKQGVRVGLLYGDRDFITNWFGGEQVSLAIAKEAGGDYAINFPASGYTPIHVNESYVGGDVRQYGNLSFSRIFQAGHSLAAYQPETAFQVFSRIVNAQEVSSGHAADLGSYRTNGPLRSTHRDRLPERVQPLCYSRLMRLSCDRKTLEHPDGMEYMNGVLYNKLENRDP